MFLDKFFKPKALNFACPMSGKLIKMENVPDPVFAEKTMGDGFAIAMTDGKVCSPVDGEVVALFPTLHAIGIKGVDRNEYLIHVGLNTVNYKGEGFKCHVEVGSKVTMNQLLIEADLDFFKDKEDVKMISPVIITNLNGRTVVLLKSDCDVKQGEKDIMAIKI